MALASAARRARPDNGGHITINPSVLYFGTPVALITSLNADGTTNISPMSSAWALGDRVVLGMSSGSMGLENVAREKELVINLPGSDLWPKVEAIARATARNPVPPHKQRIGYRFEPEKFDLGGFTPQDSELVGPKRIAECPIQFEARVVARHDPGAEWPADRPEAFQIVEAKVVRVHAHDGIVIPGTSHVDTRKWSPLLYVFRHYFGVGADLGRTFKAEV
jgi:flavin reductase (DIM6/NTAB) family NADH-FMN oxidoreductase RutF